MHATMAGHHRQVKWDKRRWLLIVLLTNVLEGEKVSAER
jgi:hypothetical protein